MHTIHSFFNSVLQEGYSAPEKSSPAILAASLGLAALAVGATAWCLCHGKSLTRPIKAVERPLLETLLLPLPDSREAGNAKIGNPQSAQSEPSDSKEIRNARTEDPQSAHSDSKEAKSAGAEKKTSEIQEKLLSAKKS